MQCQIENNHNATIKLFIFKNFYIYFQILKLALYKVASLFKKLMSLEYSS